MQNSVDLITQSSEQQSEQERNEDKSQSEAFTDKSTTVLELTKKETFDQGKKNNIVVNEGKECNEKVVTDNKESRPYIDINKENVKEAFYRKDEHIILVKKTFDLLVNEIVEKIPSSLKDRNSKGPLYPESDSLENNVEERHGTSIDTNQETRHVEDSVYKGRVIANQKKENTVIETDSQTREYIVQQLLYICYDRIQNSIPTRRGFFEFIMLFLIRKEWFEEVFLVYESMHEIGSKGIYILLEEYETNEQVTFNKSKSKKIDENSEGGQEGGVNIRSPSTNYEFYGSGSNNNKDSYKYYIPPQEDLIPDIDTYNVVLDALRLQGNIERILILFQEMEQKHRIEPDLRSYGIMFSVLINHDRVDLVSDLYFNRFFHRMIPKRSIAEGLMCGLGRHLNTGLEILSSMLSYDYDVKLADFF